MEETSKPISGEDKEVREEEENRTAAHALTVGPAGQAPEGMVTVFGWDDPQRFRVGQYSHRMKFAVLLSDVYFPLPLVHIS